MSLISTAEAVQNMARLEHVSRTCRARWYCSDCTGSLQRFGNGTRTAQVVGPSDPSKRVAALWAREKRWDGNSKLH